MQQAKGRAMMINSIPSLMNKQFQPQKVEN